MSISRRRDKIGGEQRHPEQAGQIGNRDPLALGKFGDGGELARLQHPLPAKRARQRRQPVRAQANIQAVYANFDPLDQQRYDAGLLRRKEFIP